MTSILTLRIERGQRERLKRKAQSLGKSQSEFVRELLERELNSAPLASRLHSVKGKLALGSNRSSDWRQKLRSRNWRS